MTALIAVPELAAALAGADPPVLLDVRFALGGPPGVEGYRAGHLPGAGHVDLGRDLAGPHVPGVTGRHPLPEPAAFEAAMRRAGVRSGRPVVVYDDADATAAARAWWLLRWAGHDDVRVLDGGLRAWRSAGLPVTTEVPSPASGDLVVRPGRLPVLDAAGAAARARDGVLLDARSVERYRGEVEPVDPVAGHVPGALSAPTTDNLLPDGRFRPVEELRRRFDDLGAGGDRPVGVYCGSGVTAAHQVLALSLAGVAAELYVGSWSDWITDPDRPVEVGGAGR